MRIVCPFCDAAYDVPETVLTTRPMLRCARCASDFRLPGSPEPPPPAPEEDAPREPPPPAIEAAPQAPPPPAPAPAPPPPAAAGPERAHVLYAWAGSLAVILVALWLGIAHRSAVMHAWPPSVRLYALFGAVPK